MLLKNVEKTTVNAGFAILMSDITTVWWTTVTPRASNFNLAFKLGMAFQFREKLKLPRVMGG